MQAYITKDRQVSFRLAQPDMDDWKGYEIVLTGTGDSCAEAISSGVVRTGTAMLQFGSTLFLNLCTDRLIREGKSGRAPQNVLKTGLIRV